MSPYGTGPTPSRYHGAAVSEDPAGEIIAGSDQYIGYWIDGVVTHPLEEQEVNVRSFVPPARSAKTAGVRQLSPRVDNEIERRSFEIPDSQIPECQTPAGY